MAARTYLPLVMLLGAALTFVAGPAPCLAGVTFFVQREGCPEDNGHALFVQSLPGYEGVDFEDPDLGPLGASVSQLVLTHSTLLLAGVWGDAYVPCILYSPEFIMAGKMYNRTLLPGFALSITPEGDQPIGAFGLWLFDDGRAYDAAYLFTVVEADGAVSGAVLENTIPRDAKGHELEGFIAAVSDIGIVSVSIAAIDPQTGVSIPDVFETDHWIVAPFIAPPPPADPCPVCGDLDGDQDADLDDYLILLNAIGHDSSGPDYVLCADLDQDGIVSLVDFQAWLECYRDLNEGDVSAISGEQVHRRLLRRQPDLGPQHARLQRLLRQLAPPPGQARSRGRASAAQEHRASRQPEKRANGGPQAASSCKSRH